MPVLPLIDITLTIRRLRHQRRRRIKEDPFAVRRHTPGFLSRLRRITSTRTIHMQNFFFTGEVVVRHVRIPYGPHPLGRTRHTVQTFRPNIKTVNLKAGNVGRCSFIKFLMRIRDALIIEAFYRRIRGEHEHTTIAADMHRPHPGRETFNNGFCHGICKGRIGQLRHRYHATTASAGTPHLQLPRFTTNLPRRFVRIHEHERFTMPTHNTERTFHSRQIRQHARFHVIVVLLQHSIFRGCAHQSIDTREEHLRTIRRRKRKRRSPMRTAPLPIPTIISKAIDGTDTISRRNPSTARQLRLRHKHYPHRAIFADFANIQLRSFRCAISRLTTTTFRIRNCRRKRIGTHKERPRAIF